jgi:hypothetical protein
MPSLVSFPGFPSPRFRLARISVILLLPYLLAGACSDRGKVDQGRAIEFDKVKGTVTLIRDASPDPKKPNYSILPPAIYTIPSNPEEMGPEPKAGYRMKLDAEKKEIIVFDPTAQGFRTIKYDLVEQKEGVSRENILVVDGDSGKPKTFPIVDRSRKTITIYSPRQRLLTTFAVADEYLALPDKTWEAGDEVRIYFKKQGEALRLMNVSKTDIFQK